MPATLKISWRVAVPAVIVLVMLASFGFVRWRTLRALRQSAEEVAAEQNIRFVVRPFSAPVEDGVEWISAPAVFSQVATFRGDLFLSGPAGLTEYDSRGTLLKQYRVGRELPSSPLGRMAEGVLADAREPELILATAGEGLLAFNGRSFRQIRPEDPESRAITAILSLASGRLLLGTRKRGVLVYDGKQILPSHRTLARVHVTELAGTESDLWVGTLDRGVLHWHAGQMEQFSEAEGLPDAQVHSLAVSEEKAYVGTSLGVAEFDRGRFARVLGRGIFARSLLLRKATLLIGTMDQGVAEVPLEPRRLPAAIPPGAADLGEVRQMVELDGRVFAVAEEGLYEGGRQGFGWRKLLQPERALLTDRNISALAMDDRGRLWIGYFDRGLDLLEANGERVTHIEDEHVFCVNRILPESQSGMSAVATANGLVFFDGSGNQQQVLRRSDGLIADHVTDIAPYRGGMALATPAGLTFLDSRGARSLYAFHGLVNNHVYALASSGEQLMAGTLGGISVLDKEELLANYTTATSGLKHNWITAIVPVGREWMVGTYGAGILRLDRSGHFEPFEVATDKFEVNPNAMLATDEHVLAGTLGRGLYVYSRASGRWSVIERGLPSANVTALAAANGSIYVGTDNGLVRIREQNLPQ